MLHLLLIPENQHQLRNWPGSGSYDLSRLPVWKITKGIRSCNPASLNCPIGWLTVACRVETTHSVCDSISEASLFIRMVADDGIQEEEVTTLWAMGLSFLHSTGNNLPQCSNGCLMQVSNKSIKESSIQGISLLSFSRRTILWVCIFAIWIIILL